MTENARAVCFTVHSLAHLRAALAAGAACGRPVVALSAAGASGFAGTGWFAALAAQAHADFPAVELTAILDCGDRGGDALAALKGGARHLIFTGHPDAADRLIRIAKEGGATILTWRPPSFDLMNAKNPDYAAGTHCRTLEK